MNFYALVLTTLTLATVCFGLSQSSFSSSSSSRPPSPSHEAPGLGEPTAAEARVKRRFKLNYLVVFGLVMGADWVQGPHIYSLYDEEYGIDAHTIALLFVLGFASAGVTAPFVGHFADLYGRRRMCLLFTITYTLSCLTKMSPSLFLLSIGRVLAGAATSILFSAFESWMVSSAKSREFSDGELGEFLGRAQLVNGVVASAAGVVSDGVVNMSGTYRAPFVVSAVLLVLAGGLVRSTWGENFGGVASASEGRGWRESVRVLLKSPPLLAIAGAMCAFESSMYFFVFCWVPALQASQPEGDPALPLGIIFSCFMVAMMFGSLLYNYILTSSSFATLSLPSSPRTHQEGLSKSEIYHLEYSLSTPNGTNPRTPVISLHATLGAVILLIAAVALLGSNVFGGTKGKLGCFIVLEVMVGMYYPVFGTLRVIHHPHRTQISAVLRVPINICQKQGIRCTITIKERKKYPPRKSQGGKRIDLAKAVYGRADELPPGPLEIVAHQPRLAPPSYATFKALPQGWLKMFSIDGLIDSYEAAGRQFKHLDPSRQVLTSAVVALSAYSSSNPILFSFGPPTPHLSATAPAPDFDLRSFGYRRAQTCAELREKAVNLANEHGVLASGGRDNLASCYLLEKLMERTGKMAGKPYGAAFAAHLREALSDPVESELLTQKDRQVEIPWSWIMMLDVMGALQNGTQSSFVSTDAEVLCNPIVNDINTCMIGAREKLMTGPHHNIDWAPWLDTLLQHMDALARFSIDKLTGLSARRRPLLRTDIQTFLSHHASIFPLWSLIETLAMHSLTVTLNPSVAQSITACRHILKICFAGVVVPLHRELSRRVEDPSQFHEARVWIPETRRLVEEGARMASECMEDVPSLALLTHLMPLEWVMESWVDAVIYAQTDRLGTTFSAEERVTVLGRLLSGIKAIGWAWAGDGDQAWTLVLAAKIEDALTPSTAFTSPPSASASASTSGTAAGVEPFVIQELTPLEAYLSQDLGVQTGGGGGGGWDESAYVGVPQWV
ncbi:DUF791-domain-containing protein [Pseudohyphozyma bogoriensis]|nr:DUF791-domain-containing protein [Pseudohyphozyma bogoriensis]